MRFTRVVATNFPEDFHLRCWAHTLAENMSALMTGEYLAERAARGSRKKFARVLKKVRAAKRAPEPWDEL